MSHVSVFIEFLATLGAVLCRFCLTSAASSGLCSESCNIDTAESVLAKGSRQLTLTACKDGSAKDALLMPQHLVHQVLVKGSRQFIFILTETAQQQYFQWRVHGLTHTRTHAFATQFRIPNCWTPGESLVIFRHNLPSFTISRFVDQSSTPRLQMGHRTHCLPGTVTTASSVYRLSTSQRMFHCCDFCG